MEKKGDYLLSNQEIIGGLNSAIRRGESLKDAMMTFYQAGYDKEEIEAAAREVINQQKNPSEEVSKKKPDEKKDEKKPEEKKDLKPLQPLQPKPEEKKVMPTPAPGMPAQSKQSAEVPKHVSSYDPKKKLPEKPKSNTVTIILIFALLILLGVLAAVFLFKEDLVNFINSLLV